MQQNSIIDMDCPTTYKYCVSLMTSKLCQVGIQKHIQAWNHHRIPGSHACMYVYTVGLCFILLFFFLFIYIIGQSRGVPNQLAMQNNQVAQIDGRLIPNVDDAVTLYHACQWW